MSSSPFVRAAALMALALPALLTACTDTTYMLRDRMAQKPAVALVYTDPDYRLSSYTVSESANGQKSVNSSGGATLKLAARYKGVADGVAEVIRQEWSLPGVSVVGSESAAANADLIAKLDLFYVPGWVVDGRTEARFSNSGYDCLAKTYGILAIRDAKTGALIGENYTFFTWSTGFNMDELDAKIPELEKRAQALQGADAEFRAEYAKMDRKDLYKISMLGLFFGPWFHYDEVLAAAKQGAREWAAQVKSAQNPQ